MLRFLELQLSLDAGEFGKIPPFLPGPAARKHLFYHFKALMNLVGLAETSGEFAQ